MTYRRYAAERIGASLAVLFLAASLVYVIFHVVGPGGAVPRIDPTTKDGPAQLARLHHYEHESYGDFLWKLVGHGSLGRSIYDGDDVTAETLREAPVTLSLAGGAVVFALLVGVPLGIVWARFRRAGRVTVAPLASVALLASPAWFTIWVLYFNYEIGEPLPYGYCGLFSSTKGCGGPVDWTYHLTLPSIALGLVLAAVYAGVIRRLLSYIGRAETKDKARRKAAIAFGKLVVRNLSWLIGATFFAESFLAVPGLDGALRAYGEPAVDEAILIVATMTAVGLSLAVDLVAARFLPDWRVNEFQPQRLASGPDSSARAMSGV